VLIVVMLVVMALVIPVMSIVPTFLVTVPPAVVRAPATFPLGIQIAAPFLGLAAALSVFVNGLIESCFSALNLVLALGMVVISTQPGNSNQRHHPHSRSHNRIVAMMTNR
jgi:hypothetical protein